MTYIWNRIEKVPKDKMPHVVEECFKEIAICNEFEIEAMEIAEDHVHIFLGFPPRYSISQVVQRLKGASARRIFQILPEVKKEL